MVTRSSGCECLTSPIYFTSQTPRTEWVLKWPGQIVIAGCQTHWTKEVSEALVENKINELYKALMAQVPTTVVIKYPNFHRVVRLHHFVHGVKSCTSDEVFGIRD